MRELDSLNCALDKLNLVEAAAGTGKTHNIQNIVVRLLAERELAVESIAVVTFTEAAANELRVKLRTIIQETADAACGKIRTQRALKLLQAMESRDVPRAVAEKRLRTALLDFDKASIGTIHGFCRRLLGDFAFESGEDFTPELLADGGDLRDAFAFDAFRSLCYKGKYAALYTKILDPDVLRKLVRLKSARRELEILPESAHRGSLEEISREFTAAWDFFRNVKTGDPLSALACAVHRSKIRIPELTEALDHMIRRKLPQPEDMKKLATLHPDRVRAAANRNFSDQVEKTVSSFPLFSAVEKLLSLWTELNILLVNEALDKALRHYENYKRKHDQLTFDDMINRVGDALEDRDFVSAVTARFKAGIIDEFQDTDPVQWKIFHDIFENSTLFLVGDPRQAIYKFRGGDIEAYLAARKTVPEDRRYTLTTNYRSCGPLIREVNRWFGEHASGFAHPDIRLPEIGIPEDPQFRTDPLLVDGAPDASPLKIVECENAALTDTAADAVLSLLTSDRTTLPDGKKLRPKDIAVLVRGWENARNIREKLSDRNIPCAMCKTGNVFRTSSAEHLQTVLTGILDASDQAAVKAALATPICGVSFEELARSPESPAPRTGDLADLSRIWSEHSFYRMFRELLRRFDTESRLAVAKDASRQLTDLFQIGDLLHQESSRRQLSPRALLDHLISCRTMTGPEQFPCEQENDGDAVIICSEHGSKGLQYPVVILPCLNTAPGKTPEVYHKNGRLVTDVTGIEDAIPARDEQLQEELRLAYVAMTRARHACTVIASPPGRNKLTPLNWLWYRRSDALPPDGSPSERLKACTAETRPLPEDLLTDFPRPDGLYRPAENRAQLAAGQLSSPLPRPLTVTSYTALSPAHGARNSACSLRDDDETDETGDGLPADQNALPERLKGKIFGLLLHGIMEKLDFHATRQEIREIVAREFPLANPTAAELDYAASVIVRTLDLQLFPGVKLADIPRGKRLAEMRFHFSFGKPFRKGELTRTAAEYISRFSPIDYGDDQEICPGGFVTGSLDLFFEHGGKYFVLDWKSNLLADYSRDSLTVSIAESCYQLQYLIYLTAVIRYLRQRLRLSAFGEEEYEKYIGGVFYIYMRGASAAAPTDGIFFDRPAYADLRKISEVLE